LTKWKSALFVLELSYSPKAIVEMALLKADAWETYRQAADRGERSISDLDLLPRQGAKAREFNFLVDATDRLK
jgi:hypothetical protein